MPNEVRMIITINKEDLALLNRLIETKQDTSGLFSHIVSKFYLIGKAL